MTENPFDALGGGGFDMNALLQQAQQMQQQLEEAQANRAKQTVEGTVAGGAVTVTAPPATVPSTVCWARLACASSSCCCIC